MDNTQAVARLSKLNIISLDESALVTINNTGYYQSGSYVNLTAPQVATAYNMPFHSGAGMKVGIISFGGGFKQSDINLTFSSFQTNGLIPVSFTVPTIHQILLNGATGQFGVDAGADAENALDIACVATLIPEATINIYINTSTNFISDFQSTIARAISDGCDVITMSWTFSESSGDFLATQLQLANSNKIAFVNSSGDFGSDNSGVESVNYPTSSPYIIGVGGTHLTINTGTNTRLTETTEQNDSRFSFGVGSGGGFSTLFSAPSWQNGLSYQTYNSSTNVYGTLTPVTMRGVPDISGPMANSYVFYYNGNLVAAGGTSAATPVMAGMLARFKALTGKAFSSEEYNKLFYANLNAFYDITTGTNATYLPQGYAARVGWDPVTGIGAPDGYSLLNVIIGLRPNQGIEWPRLTGIRPSIGQAFPRSKLKVNNSSLDANFTTTNLSAYASSAQLGGRLSGGSVAVSTYCTWTFSSGNVTMTASGIPFHAFYNAAAANVPYVQSFNSTWTYRGGTNVSGTQPATSGGRIGFWLNGVSMFNPSAQGGAPGGYITYTNWHYNAAFEEGVEAGYSFGEDDAGGHAAPNGVGNGTYHYHDGSILVTGAWVTGLGHTSGTYGVTGVPEISVFAYLRGGLTHSNGHSKIMGISADGYPIYGPYGYATATDATSGVRRMVPGYTINPTFVANGARTTNGITPPVNSQYPLGMFVEDWSFVGGGDLDTHNGRYCVTPEYPLGTYAYFLAFNDSLKPTYPYVIGNTYYGTPASI